jgi:acetyl esterase/lipase
MDIQQVAPELRETLGRMPKPPMASAVGRWIIQAAMALMRSARVDGVTIRTVKDGPAKLRVYTPDHGPSKGALLWIHGGGYIIGRAVIDDRICADTAKKLGILVVSAEYRVAPRHPFPAALDDCHAVWRWLHANAPALGIDPAAIAVGGESAGGGLAAGLVQRIHDEGGPQPAAQWLFCPMIDDRTAARQELDAVGHFLWTNALNRLGWTSYLAATPGSADLPAYAAPARRTDLSGLPPAWIGVGDIDLFAAEDEDYARRLAAAGVDTTFQTVTGAPHGFEAWAYDTDFAQQFIGAAQEWLRSRLIGG